MRLIYDKNVLKYNLLEDKFEGSYRLKGIENEGRLIQLDFNVEKDILGVHTPRHLQKIKGHCKSKMPLAEIKVDSATLNAIYSSVRLAIYASDNEDLAMTRPPGHHSTKEGAKGFCFVNNISIASQRLLSRGKKICVIDIDGHHGDGTEQIFYNRNRLLFCSVYQEGGYPSNKGDLTHIGSGLGKGYNLSLPIPKGSGDDILLDALNFFKKYIHTFKPDMIGISAGFDGYIKDRLLNLKYTLNGYRQFGKNLREFGCPVFGVLEGGYHNEVVLCAKTLVDGINGSKFRAGDLSSSSDEVHSKFRENINRLEGELDDYRIL